MSHVSSLRFCSIASSADVIGAMCLRVVILKLAPLRMPTLKARSRRAFMMVAGPVMMYCFFAGAQCTVKCLRLGIMPPSSCSRICLRAVSMTVACVSGESILVESGTASIAAAMDIISSAWRASSEMLMSDICGSALGHAGTAGAYTWVSVCGVLAAACGVSSMLPFACSSRPAPPTRRAVGALGVASGGAAIGCLFTTLAGGLGVGLAGAAAARQAAARRQAGQGQGVLCSCAGGVP